MLTLKILEDTEANFSMFLTISSFLPLPLKYININMDTVMFILSGFNYYVPKMVGTLQRFLVHLRGFFGGGIACIFSFLSAITIKTINEENKDKSEQDAEIRSGQESLLI